MTDCSECASLGVPCDGCGFCEWLARMEARNWEPDPDVPTMTRDETTKALHEFLASALED